MGGFSFKKRCGKVVDQISSSKNALSPKGNG